MIRLDKFLSEAAMGSRKELKAMIRQGRVTVDGETVRVPDTKIQEGQEIRVDGQTVNFRGTRVLLLHKPAGYVTSTADPRDKTVMELLPRDFRDLKPVGRLDKDTEGLLLLTDDGDLAHRLISPKHRVEKEYYARISGTVDAADVEAFAAGILLRDGTRCLPAKLQPVQDGCLVTVHEGKYHQVRRMLAARGKPVTYLRRIREGGLTMGELAPGEYRLLTPEEIRLLEQP